MSFTIPTLAELARRAEAELKLETAGDFLRRNLFTPVARAVAAAVSGLYGHQYWISRQILPHTCDDDVLEEFHAPFWLDEGKKAAESASGTIRVFGNSGSVIEQGTLWNRADGVQYTNPNEATLTAAGYLDIKVVCMTPGQDGNTEPGGELLLASTVAGVDGSATVQSPGLTGGADEETTEELRARVMEVRRSGGQVGKSADWEIWTKEIEGVTRAWAAPQLAGIGTITVFFVRDDDADIFPDENECATVQAHLEATGTPFGEIYAIAPIRKPIDFTIRVSPNTTAVRTAVESALADLIASVAAPVARDSYDVTARPLSGVTLLRSHITNAISDAVGETDSKLIVPAEGVDVVCAIGELAELGEITWQN